MATAVKDIAQMRRIVFRSRESATEDWTTFVLTPEDLGQDTMASFNISPRIKDRSTLAGTTHKPVAGTYDDFSATITFQADVWAPIFQALGQWNPATFTGATSADGNAVGAAAVNPCGTQKMVSVILQGICDDGSTADAEFARCFPSIDGELEISGSSSTEVSLALNPQIYNPTTMANDGYEQYDYRFGTKDLEENQRLDVTTGKYNPVTPTETTPAE